jgi:hypothetical protein
LLDEELVNVSYNRDLWLGPWDKDDAVGLQTLPLPAAKKTLGSLITVDQLAAPPVAGWSTLPASQLDQAALTGENLDRQLAAVFRSHRAFQGLEHRRRHAAVVLELLGAVVDANSSSFEDVLVIGALVGVLEPAPPADVVDEQGSEIDLLLLHIGHQLIQAASAGFVETTPAMVGVNLDDLHIVIYGVLPDDGRLVLRRVLLVFG